MFLLEIIKSNSNISSIIKYRKQFETSIENK